MTCTKALFRYVSGGMGLCLAVAVTCTKALFCCVSGGAGLWPQWPQGQGDGSGQQQTQGQQQTEEFSDMFGMLNPPAPEFNDLSGMFHNFPE